MTPPTPKPVYKDGPGITAKQLRILMRHFELDQLASVAAKNATVSIHTANRYYRAWREAIYKTSLKAPRLFGEIEMDQGQVGGINQKKLRALKKQYSRLPHNEYWRRVQGLRDKNRVQIFTIAERKGQVFCQIIRFANERTLVPIIRLVVEQGSTIYTDKWRAYSKLASDGYFHHSVNHSDEYITKHGHHVNNVESFHSFAKRRLYKFNGLPRHTLVLHIKECEFRWNHRNNLAKALKAII